MKTFRFLISFAVALSFIFILGYAAGLMVFPDGEWYISLNKPVFAPSARVYNICWIFMYVFMSAAITFTVENSNLRRAMYLWFALLMLNVLWCAAFYIWKLTLFALSVIATECIIIVALTSFYARNTRKLWFAMIPLAVWYIYLFAVDFCIVMLN